MQADAEDLYPCDRRNPYTDSGVLTDGHRKAYVKEVVMGNTRDKIGKAGLVLQAECSGSHCTYVLQCLYSGQERLPISLDMTYLTNRQ